MSTEDYSFIYSKFIEINESVLSWGRNYKKVALNIRNIPEFVETVYDASFKIYEKYNIVLDILLKKPALNVMDIYLQIQDRKKGITNEDQRDPRIDRNEYKKIQRMIKDLLNLMYIEKLPEKKANIGNFEKVRSIPYQLSLAGIFYIIMNHRLFEDVWFVLEHLIKNYSNNILFQYFLYPYFEISTLKESIMHTLIIEYLQEVCHLIKYHLKWKVNGENLIEGYVPFRLFSWPNQDSITTNSSSITQENWSSLKEYLEKEMGWKWIYDAKVIADYTKNIITIQSDELATSSIIFINRQEKKAVLKFNGINYNIFDVDDSYGKLEILKKFFKEKDLRSDSFKNGLLNKHVLLLTGIYIQGTNMVTNNIKIYSKILSTDEKFVRLTNRITCQLQEAIKK